MRVSAGQYVHVLCQINWINPNYIASAGKANLLLPSSTKKRLRSDGGAFDFSKHCLFCGQPSKIEGKKKVFDLIQIHIETFRKTIEDVCKERKDEWSETVKLCK